MALPCRGKGKWRERKGKGKGGDKLNTMAREIDIVFSMPAD